MNKYALFSIANEDNKPGLVKAIAKLVANGKDDKKLSVALEEIKSDLELLLGMNYSPDLLLTLCERYAYMVTKKEIPSFDDLVSSLDYCDKERSLFLAGIRKAISALEKAGLFNCESGAPIVPSTLRP